MTEPVDTAYYHLSSDATPEELLAVSKLYARDVVERHGLSVDVTELDWEVSTRAKRRAGAVHHRDGVPLSISLTWAFFRAQGWEAMAETVRHELVHVHLLNEHDDGSHGDRFQRWATRLRTGTHCERFSPPTWWIICTDCGHRLARYRRSKLVEHVGSYRCGECGGELRREVNER